MLRTVASKVAWVGRTASMVFGLALVMALVLGATSVALAGNLDPLKIGSIKNVATKTTQLVGKVASGSAFAVNNPSGGSALGLQVNAGQAPMTVNAEAGKATNLDADKLDGKDASEFAPSAHPHAGEDITSGTVSEGRIDPAVARDAEVVDTVKASDGAGSGLDADSVDGKSSEQLKGATAYALVRMYSSGNPYLETEETSGFNLVTRGTYPGTYCIRLPLNGDMGVYDKPLAVTVDASHTQNPGLASAMYTSEGAAGCTFNSFVVTTTRTHLDYNQVSSLPANDVSFTVVLP